MASGRKISQFDEKFENVLKISSRKSMEFDGKKSQICFMEKKYCINKPPKDMENNFEEHKSRSWIHRAFTNPRH